MMLFPEAGRPRVSGAMAVALFALSACSQPDAVDNAAGATPEPVAVADNVVARPAAETMPVLPTPSPLPSVPPDGETIGGDGSPIRLSPLSEKDIAGAEITGELACSFAQGRDATLLLARGDVASKERAWGVIKVGDYVERVSAPGGYDAMLRGGTFAGKGTTLRLALTGPAAGGGESPPRPATLTYLRADGASRVFRGAWTCGP